MNSRNAEGKDDGNSFRLKRLKKMYAIQGVLPEVICLRGIMARLLYLP